MSESDPWEIVHRESNGAQRWTTTTARTRVDGGYMYRVSTYHSNEGGIVTACSESISFVPDIKAPSTKR